MSSDTSGVAEAIRDVVGLLPQDWRVVAARLQSDPRMEPVWMKLLEQKSVNYRYCETHACRLGLEAWFKRASNRFGNHEVACALFFVEATRQFSGIPRIFTKADMKRRRERYQAAAALCDELLRKHGNSCEHIRALETAREILSSESPIPPDILVILARAAKRRGDDSMRVRVITLSEIASLLFDESTGGVMGYQIADIANAASGSANSKRAMTAKNIENWLKVIRLNPNWEGYPN